MTLIPKVSAALGCSTHTAQAQSPAGLEERQLQHDQDDKHQVNKDILIEENRTNQWNVSQSGQWHAREHLGVIEPLDVLQEFCEIKAVNPVAKMLITVPEITWLTLYLIDNTPRIRANTIEDRIPPKSPSHGLLVTLPTIAATMEAISIMPSIEMLMIPERSARMPEKAPKVIGTASKTALESIPARLSCCPAACQTRKAKIRNNAQIPIIRLVHFLKPLINWKTPMTNGNAARIISVVFEGKIQSAIKPWSIPPGVITNLVRVSAVVFAAKAKRSATRSGSPQSR